MTDRATGQSPARVQAWQRCARYRQPCRACRSAPSARRGSHGRSQSRPRTRTWQCARRAAGYTRQRRRARSAQSARRDRASLSSVLTRRPNQRMHVASSDDSWPTFSPTFWPPVASRYLVAISPGRDLSKRANSLRKPAKLRARQPQGSLRKVGTGIATQLVSTGRNQAGMVRALGAGRLGAPTGKCF
jgi:hypothetical protein